MKIVRVETHVCHARMRNWVFVKVVTDRAGLLGTSSLSHARVVGWQA